MWHRALFYTTPLQLVLLIAAHTYGDECRVMIVIAYLSNIDTLAAKNEAVRSWVGAYATRTRFAQRR